MSAWFILTLVLPQPVSVKMQNAALTSQRKTWFILEPNINVQGPGKEIPVFPKGCGPRRAIL